MKIEITDVDIYKGIWLMYNKFATAKYDMNGCAKLQLHYLCSQYVLLKLEVLCIS